MKKVLGIVLLLLLAFGIVSGFSAHATPQGTCGNLGTPIDVQCINPDPNYPGFCDVWIAPGTTSSWPDGCNRLS